RRERGLLDAVPEGREPGHRLAVCGRGVVVPAGRLAVGRGPRRALHDDCPVDGRDHGGSSGAAAATTGLEPAAGWSRVTDDQRGRSAIVTGASRGIGRGIALALAARGWRLTLAARDRNRLAAVAAEAEAAGASYVDIVDVDLSTPDAPTAVLAAHTKHHDS